MAATSIFFNGRMISVPGSYTEVDASGLESVGLGATGIVAIIGTAVGGRPVIDGDGVAMDDPEDFITFTKPEAARAKFISGDLREACSMVFEPGNDPDIPGGAVRVYAMKVNPAKQSTLALTNAGGTVLTMTSVDYGAHTEQINVTVGAGTNSGKLLTITFEDKTESGDDIGGAALATLKYEEGVSTNGYSTATYTMASGALTSLFTKTAAGKDNAITAAALAGARAAAVLSNSAADTAVTVRVYGILNTGATAYEDIVTNGTTPVPGTKLWAAAKVLGAEVISGTHVGTLTVEDSVSPFANICTMSAGTTSAGLQLCDANFVHVGTAVSLISSGASTKDVLVFGKTAAGTSASEKITLTGTVLVAGAATTLAQVDRLVMGEVENAQTVTMSGTGLKTTAAVHTTLQKMRDYANSRQVSTGDANDPLGFIFTITTGEATLAITNLDDVVAATNILTALGADILADQYSLVTWINTNSTLVTAVAGASQGFPSNTVNPAFLTGGEEGTATNTHWQKAFSLLKKIRVNTVVPLTHTASVHADANAHCKYMGGVGRSERDALVGAMNAGGTALPTKAELKTQVVALNSQHVRLCGQSIDKFNTAGVKQTFDSRFQAVIGAGMQAGSEVGTSLTFKYANVIAVKQDASWNPVDDSEEMIQAGVCFMERIDGIGRRWVRNITTHLSTSNIARVEASVNEAVNFATFNFRTNMESAVGKRGFAGTINAAKAVAVGTLGLLVDNNIIVKYRSLSIELIVDVLEVSVELAPVIPVNFVKSTIHLVTIAQAAV